MNPTIRSPLVRFYLWQGRRWISLLRVLDGLHAGVWLGLLSRAHLEAIDELHYHGSSTYNGEAHNLRGLMDWEERAISGFFRGRKRLLLIGAGGGRELLALERLGHEVEGFECNPALVSFARTFLAAQGARGTVRLLERNAAPPESRYDGLIMGWGSYMLIAGRTERVELLRRLRRMVPDGTPLLLSFFTEPEATTRLRTVYHVARRIRWLLRRELPELGDDLMPLFVHRFNEGKIAAEMRDAGFLLARYEPEGRGKHDSGWAVGAAISP